MAYLSRALRGTTIRTSLSAGFGLALALIVLIGAVSVYQFRALNHFATEITDSWLPETEELGRMRRALAEHRLLAIQRSETTNYRQLAAIVAEAADVRTVLTKAASRYRDIVDDRAKTGGLDRFEALWSDYEASLADVLAMLDSGNPVEGRELLQTRTLSIHDGAEEQLSKLIDVSRQEGIDAAGDARRLYNVSLFLMIAVIAGAAGLVVAAIFWVTRNISNPILAISDTMNRLSRGESAAAPPDVGDRNDEIGILASAAASYGASLERSRELTAETEKQRVRFAAAVDNMPIGLSMFDQNGELIVSNDRYAEIYGLTPGLAQPGIHWRAILDRQFDAGVLPDERRTRIGEMMETVRGGERALDMVELLDGRTVSVIHQPMTGGGWVSTHEDVTDRRRNESRIAHMARHDVLTNLPNRVLLREQLDAMLERTGDQGMVAVLCLDLDRFKAVNDTLGHPIGDQLLKAVAQRLLECVGDEALVSRMGGDEFAIIQHAEDQPNASKLLAQRVIDTLCAPYQIDGHQMVIGTSVGIALAPADGRDADRLLKNGDMALYRAKSDGRGVYRFFEQEMDTLMQARRELELDLRAALVRREFELHFQPLVSLSDSRISAFEALLRWRHPRRGLVAPGEFISVAEEIGLIVPIGEWVLKQACKEAAKWPEHVRLAVNLSPVQFRSDRLVHAAVTALAASGLAPSRLELEITETVLLADTEKTLSILHQLKSLGIHISMDDFGTGYSSLSYLRSFPFDKIKIDRSFVHDMAGSGNSLAIIRAVTGLSKSLGIATVGEGVETAKQMESLRLEGCTEAQGFLISRPVPASEIAGLLDKSSARGHRAA